MNIIIYNDQEHPDIMALKTRVLDFEDIRLTRVADHKSFIKSLRCCLAGECMIVFFISSKKDMVFLEAVEKYFMDVKLIICFTIKDVDLTSRAYALSPRIVISTDSGRELLPEAVAGILKFKENINNSIHREGENHDTN